MGQYAKTIVAALLAGAMALQAALSDGGVTNQEWVAIGIAALTALTVYLVPNAPREQPVSAADVL